MSDVLSASPLVRAIGVALVEFVWQGALLALIAGVALSLLRGASAASRYATACIAFVAMAVSPLVTGYQAYASLQVGPARDAGIYATVAANAQAAVTGGPVASVLLRDGWMPIVVTVWAVGVVLLAAYLASGWLVVSLLRRSGVAVARDRQADLLALAGRMGVSRLVRLAESARVGVPTVVGWVRPVILVPASTLGGLTPSQLEAILMHELAHVRRHDYLVNLGQSVVETLLFYHPAVWWLSKRIRTEREQCCDDLVVGLCGDGRMYARALATIEEHRAGAPALALSANGGDLTSRIRRLLGVSPVATRRPSVAATAAIIVVLPFLVAGETAQTVERTRVSSSRTTVGASAPDSHVLTPRQPKATNRIVQGQREREWLEINRRAEELAASIASRQDSPQPAAAPPPPPPSPPAEPTTVQGVRPSPLSPEDAAKAAREQQSLQLQRMLTETARHVNAGRFAEASRLLDELQALLDKMPASPATSVVPGSAGAPIRVGGAVATPIKIHDVRPVYPANAKAAGVQGLVILEAVIDESGSVTSTKVLRGTPLLDEAALEAVSQWRYSTPTLNGSPVTVIMTVTVNFTLN